MALPGDRGDAGGDLLDGGVVAGAQAAGQPAEVVAGAVEFLDLPA
jgi:hypothetical protein